MAKEEAIYRKAIYLNNLGRYEEALDIISYLPKGSKESEILAVKADIVYKQACSLSEEGKYREALQKFEEVSKLTPVNSLVLYGRSKA